MYYSFLSNIRRNIFWTIDFLKGKDCHNAYNIIKMIDNMDSSEAYIDNHQKRAFSKLAAHSVKTTNFYKKFDINELNGFPIINKNIIKENQNDFISDIFRNKSMIKMSTSGSTGTPFISYQNIRKRKTVIAEIIYYSEKAGYKLGENIIYLRAITEKTKKSWFKKFLQNEKLIDISSLKDSKIAEIILNIKDVSRNGSIILAYASTYDALKDYFIKYGTEISQETKITGMISISEMLFDKTREVMEEAFNCKIYSRYSNQENGIIAQETTIKNLFILNEANYIVEIFDLEKDRICSNNEMGRIVVTDLYNYTMPMIRYDTGDIGEISIVKCNGKTKKVIKNLGGRMVDIVYDTSGNRLSPHIITNKFWDFQDIIQYQFIQDDINVYTVRINVDTNWNKNKELEIMLKNLLGSDAIISIELKNEIPILQSGKRKYIVNKMQTGIK